MMYWATRSSPAASSRRSGLPLCTLKTQLAVLQGDLALLQRTPFVAGFTLWCFNDYATLRKERYKRYSGIVDAWRISKAATYWLSATFGGRLVPPTPGESGPSAAATALALTPEQASMPAADRGTLGVGIKVVGGRGKRVAWKGVLGACVEGPARLRSFDRAG